MIELFVAILIAILLLVCKEYYSVYRMLDRTIVENKKMRERYSLMREYIDYYTEAIKGGIEHPMTLQEYIQMINK